MRRPESKRHACIKRVQEAYVIMVRSRKAEFGSGLRLDGLNVRGIFGMRSKSINKRISDQNKGGRRGPQKEKNGYDVGINRTVRIHSKLRSERQGAL